MKAVKTPALKPADDFEPVFCPACGERVRHGIELVESPVKQAGRAKWSRAHSRRFLACGACYREGKTVKVAE